MFFVSLWFRFARILLSDVKSSFFVSFWRVLGFLRGCVGMGDRRGPLAPYGWSHVTHSGGPGHARQALLAFQRWTPVGYIDFGSVFVCSPILKSPLFTHSSSYTPKLKSLRFCTNTTLFLGTKNSDLFLMNICSYFNLFINDKFLLNRYQKNGKPWIGRGNLKSIFEISKNC